MKEEQTTEPCTSHDLGFKDRIVWLGRALAIGLQIVGALTLISPALKFVLPPNLREIAKKEFGSPETISEIQQLYKRVESVEDKEEMRLLKDQSTYYPTVRRIPQEWLPRRFFAWGNDFSSEYLQVRDVIACYDEQGRLVGIEFNGSRIGCFVSRDPTRSPARYGTMQRLTGEPLFIGSWFQEAD